MFRISGFCMLIWLATSPIQAAIVVFNAQGTITTVNQGGSSGTPIANAGQINIGDTFTATLSYDTATAGADSNGANTSNGIYSIAVGANNFITFNIDGLVFQSTAGLLAQTFNNVNSTLSANTDLLAVQSSTNVLPVQWAGAATTAIAIADPNGNALPNDALPTSISSQFSTGSIQISINSATVNGTPISGLFIEGLFNIAAVPEPASLVCFGLLAPIAYWTRRRRHKATESK